MRLGRALEAGELPRRAVDRAAAAGPDDGLVGAAEAAGQEARRLGRAAHAAAWLAQAAVSSDPGAADRRLLDALEILILYGEVAEAEVLAARVAAAGPGARRSGLLGALDVLTGRAAAAEVRLLEAWQAHDPAREAAVGAAAAYWLAALCLLPDAKDADEDGIRDADGESGESGGLVGQVSAASARCRDGRREGPEWANRIAVIGGVTRQRAGGAGNGAAGLAGRGRAEQLAAGQHGDPGPRAGVRQGEPVAQGHRGGPQGVECGGERVRAGLGGQGIGVQRDDGLDAHGPQAAGAGAGAPDPAAHRAVRDGELVRDEPVPAPAGSVSDFLCAELFAVRYRMFIRSVLFALSDAFVPGLSRGFLESDLPCRSRADAACPGLRGVCASRAAAA